jgi:hypothetical protein
MSYTTPLLVRMLKLPRSVHNYLAPVCLLAGSSAETLATAVSLSSCSESALFLHHVPTGKTIKIQVCATARSALRTFDGNSSVNSFLLVMLSILPLSRLRREHVFSLLKRISHVIVAGTPWHSLRKTAPFDYHTDYYAAYS